MSDPTTLTELEPRRLELTLDPHNGSLQTASLLHVLLTATDGLFQDLYQMTTGDIDVAAPDEEGLELLTTTTTTTTKKRMADLAFSQRRHELAWRLAKHARTIEQVAVLTAAAATTDWSTYVTTSSQALQHARMAWSQADEAQDALFFFHAQLFPLRAAPHDIVGAADVQLLGQWYDLPQNLLLQTDPYETSVEASWSWSQVDEAWQMAVRRKLILGEMGWDPNSSNQLWKLSLRGGLVRLTCGNPRPIEGSSSSSSCSCSKQQYPIAAVLTVVPSNSSDNSDEWTLLNLNVHVQAKTGEFNYQLECSHRQKYDLHRLAALAMHRAEMKTRKLQQEAEEEEMFNANVMQMNDDIVPNTVPPARPLEALFQVAHTFLLSWQLEVLSAQALGLRRGAWGAVGIPIQVQPVQFEESSSSSLGVLSILFWKVDDSYGPPRVGNLSLDQITDDGQIPTKKARYSQDAHGQLVLAITAECGVGIQVSMSGAQEILAQGDVKTKSIVQDLLDATTNPFALSASDALLAAARLCAYQKCQAVVEALQPPILPHWIDLSLDHGSIVVAAKIQFYYGKDDESRDNGKGDHSPLTILFRVQCDLRTGSFVPTFPRPFHLLGTLAGADPYHQASELMAMRVASLPLTKQRAAGASSTGRCVREAFDALMRSMNLLGQRVGVGGSWDDTDLEGSPKLRQRAIQGACADVRTCLTKCCAMSALYGLAPVATRIAVGLDASPDMAGNGTDKRLQGMSLLSVPPLSIRLDQELVERTVSSSDGVPKKDCHLEQILFSLSCRISNDGVVLVPLEVTVQLDSPAAEPMVKEYEMLNFEKTIARSTPSKGDAAVKAIDPVPEAGYLADLISNLIDDSPNPPNTT
ncbi:hypothetical protein FisN_17Lh124 [Fistulifera solaris]|uniref:Mediator of RNA polymerase II transcription subunit 14 n=1 Tax=Fistulifera solaris TaxID=1519565 RepID=A0A1Z5K8Z2_FISSO|nr:hypothetical protein FisN_17Lh124 [Fistulifera solaris]|eukprot:GAX22632.1 hypothetical protein FisN_17Lh124 [Fistulifera solaris]